MKQLIAVFLVMIALTKVVNSAPQLIYTDDDGNIGVNFFGFKAQVGLGGLLNGDLSKGSLSASASTPFGQSARAGLGGQVGSNNAAGGLYADAKALPDLGAGAQLYGDTDKGGVARAYARDVEKIKSF